VLANELAEVGHSVSYLPFAHWEDAKSELHTCALLY